MKKQLALACIGLAAASGASAVQVSWTVTSGTVLTSTPGGLGCLIVTGVGTPTGGATGVIS